MNKGIFKSKRFKHGSFAVIFSVVFIVLIIAFNLIITAVDSKYVLKIDLTSTETFSVSEDTDKALQIGLGDAYKDFDITIYFLMARDMLDVVTNTTYNDPQYYSRIRDIAEQFAIKYPNNIKIEYVDINSNPAFAQKYTTETQNALTANNVIVQGKYHYRVLTFNAFYLTGTETVGLYGVQAESKFTAAILQSSIKERPVIAFTKGHGEAGTEGVKDLLDNSGFEIMDVDLDKEDIDPRVEILVVYNPINDFLGYKDTGTNVNEISKITRFMADDVKFHSLMVFVNSNTEELESLQEYLWEYWGIRYKTGCKLSDPSNSIQNGLNFYNVIGKYNINESDSVGNAIIKTAAAKNLKTSFNNAVALEADPKSKTGITTSVLMTTHSTASYTYKNENGEDVTKTGEVPLMLLSTTLKYGENNAAKYKYVMLVGSTDYASSTGLSTTYSNRDIIYGAVRNMSTDRVIPEIDYKVFDKTGLTLTTEQANTLMIMISAIIPFIIIVVGIVVFFKRRHK